MVGLQSTVLDSTTVFQLYLLTTYRINSQASSQISGFCAVSSRWRGNTRPFFNELYDFSECPDLNVSKEAEQGDFFYRRTFKIIFIEWPCPLRKEHFCSYQGIQPFIGYHTTDLSRSIHHKFSIMCRTRLSISSLPIAPPLLTVTPMHFPTCLMQTHSGTISSSSLIHLTASSLEI